MNSPYTTLGWPPDGVAWVALGAACATSALLFGTRRQGLALTRRPDRLIPVLAFSAALLSLGYLAYYLRGGPRIVDATSYYLQARAMAHGYFAFPVPAPLASFNGRFLLAGAPRTLSVIFPPGYAALLALGFLAHMPLLIGPLLGALLVLVTYALARELSGRADVGCVAAGLSVLCAALRYHTADTMSHGWCALLLCVGTWTALRARRWDALLSGLCFGWLIATRPVSGVVGLVLGSCLLERKPRDLISFALGLLPGLALLLAYQHAATGSYWSSTQLAYYALADGPPGCFRYGFGRGIGCLHEHGDYVRARLAGGYGLTQAAGVTLRRLAVHSTDIANAAPLALLCPAGAWLGRSDSRVRCIFFACLGFMLAYAPFYFDASYPGGGARLFSDLLPLEHVLLAIALVRLGWSSLAVPLSLAGFALHTSFAHRALAEREGGRPMFEARALARAGIDHGLVFVDTDHGFNLGHDPGQWDATRHVVVARHEHDAHDFLLWNRLGRPPTYHYLYSPAEAQGSASLVPYAPSAEPLRLEAEGAWPPLAVRSGWLQPDFFPCASGGRGLRLHPTGPETEMALDLELVGADWDSHSLSIGWVRDSGPSTTLTLRQLIPGELIPGKAGELIPGEAGELIPGEAGELIPGKALGRRAWGAISVVIPGGEAGCMEANLGQVTLSPSGERVELTSSRPGLVDYVEVRR